MNIINGLPPKPPIAPQNKTPNTPQKKPQKAATPQPAVVYEKSTGVVYDSEKIEALKQRVENKLSSLRNTVKTLIEEQGLNYRDVIQGVENGETVAVEIDETTRQNAAAEIAEDGFWGVSATANRIVDFAKTISGDNPEKLSLLKNAIQEGFEAAKQAFGGELPDISQQTYDAVMTGLDEWATEKET